MKLQKFCTGCQQYRDPDKLTKVLRNKVYRNICDICLHKASVSIYAKVKNDRLRTALYPSESIDARDTKRVTKK